MFEMFQGQVAFITGGASGIGLGMARVFAQEGMKLAIADIDPGALADAAAQIRALGAEVLALQLDVRTWDNWQGIAEQVEARLGPVRVLCNNAGTSLGVQRLEDTVIADWNRIFDVNVHGVLHGIRTFANRMGDNGGGHIVNTSSAGGLCGTGHMGPPGRGAYVATKFAVVGLSEVLRSELAPRNIGVSVLCPGPVSSLLLRKAAAERGVPLPPDTMEPDDIGRQVVHAIRDNRLYIVTHASRRTPVAARHAQIEAAFDALERETAAST